MMTDPIADMLTRIRNALARERPSVDIPCSNVKIGIAQCLQREGYIWDYEIVEEPPAKILRVNLKYGQNGERAILHVKRLSTPGRRRYSAIRRVKDVLQGMGISVLSTSQGILSHREARAKNVGGELLCEVW